MRLSSLPFLDGLIDAAICCVQQEQNCMRRHPHTFPRDGQQRVDSPSTHVAMWRQLVNSYKTNALRVDLPPTHVAMSRQLVNSYKRNKLLPIGNPVVEKQIMHWPSEEKD